MTAHVSNRQAPDVLVFVLLAQPFFQLPKGVIALKLTADGNEIKKVSSRPGGWNIIGNSPIKFFDVSKKTPCFAKSGDKLQFYPITLKEHKDITTLVNAGVYQLEREELYD